jgi:hypothetical protein
VTISSWLRDRLDAATREVDAMPPWKIALARSMGISLRAHTPEKPAVQECEP